MADNDVLTWADVERQLKPLGRGAPYRLAQHLAMNSSYFYRKLRSGGDLSERQARGVREFLAGAAPEPSDMAPQDGRRRFPVFGYAAPGGGDLISLDPTDVVEHLELPMGIEVGPGDWFVVRAIGSSMEPRIFAGDPLLVRRRHPPIRGRDALVEFSDGSAVIKTYQGERAGQVFVEQWNDRRVLHYEATTVKAIHGGIIKL